MVAPQRKQTLAMEKRMKLRIPLLLATAVLVVDQSSALAQGPRGGGKPPAQPPRSDPAVEQALMQALAGPDGEYANYAEYAAIVQKRK